MNKIKLPKKERPAGLYLYCNKHKRTYSSDSAVKCKCDNLVYKCKIHVPGKDDKCKTKNLEARNFDDALIEFRAFKKELANNSFQTIAIAGKELKPIFFVDCVEVFMEYLRDEGVAHQFKQYRTKPVLKQAERALAYMGYALIENKIDPTILKFTDINDKMAGYVHEYLLETRKLSNKTFNNLMSDIKRFMRYIIDKYNLHYKSPFAGIKKRKVVTKIKSISMDEFTRLLALVTHKNSYRSKKEKKKGANFYKPWFVNAFKLGLFTGGRRLEVVAPKWTSIKLTPHGELSHIEIEHFKLNRANKNLITEDELEFKKVIINSDLEDLLIELGYEKNKNKDTYILAPEETMSREHMIEEMSYAFNRYYKLLNTGEVKQFKHLRKSYITALYIKKGNETNKYTDHEGMDILHASYIDKDVVLEAKRNELKKLGSLFKN